MFLAHVAGGHIGMEKTLLLTELPNSLTFFPKISLTGTSTTVSNQLYVMIP